MGEDRQEDIDVGEADDTFRLYMARTAWEMVKEEAERQGASIQRIKARATSLLGWSVTLTSASVAAFFSVRFFSLSLLASSILFSITGILCVLVLYPTNWYYTNYTLKNLDELEKSSELEVLEQLCENQCSFNARNVPIYKKLQNFMKLGWIIFASTPVVVFIFALVELVFGHYP